MSTTIRSNISKKNKYWIEKHRYLELRQFCFQYPIWKGAYRAIDGLQHRPWDLVGFSKGDISNVVEKAAEQGLYYSERMRLVESTCYEADPSIAKWLLEGVTTGLTYEKLNAREQMPCCREYYYNKYRKFFYLLNKYHY